MTDWDADGDQLHANLNRLLPAIRRDALARVTPTVELARRWHTMMMDGLRLPKQDYVGRFRGEPGLERYGVRIGPHYGVPSHQVASALGSFEATLQRAVQTLDAMIERGSDRSADQVAAIVDLCAWVHCEWVRIHPLANGNGRTARLWANFIAMRFGLPAFVRIRPRPHGGYAAAAAHAMQGDWRATVPVFRRMYRDALRE
jgi:Fic family protein